MLALILLLDILLAIIREAIFIGVTPNKHECSTYLDLKSTEVFRDALQNITGDSRAAVVSLVLILLPIAILFMIAIIVAISLAYSCCKNRPKCRHKGTISRTPLLTILKCKFKQLPEHTWTSSAVCIFQCLFLIPYLYVDNIEYILHRYSAELGCDKECVDVNLTIARVLSVLAAVLLNLYPHTAKYVGEGMKWNYEQHEIEKQLKIWASILKIEAAYSAFAIAVQYRSYCHPVEYILGWTLLVACVFAGAVAMYVEFHKSTNATCPNILQNICTLFLLVCLMFVFLVTDNSQPLGCAYNCDLYHSNTTTFTENLVMVDSTHCCDIRANAVTRLVLTIVALLLLGATAIPAVMYKCYSNKKNKVAPH